MKRSEKGNRPERFLVISTTGIGDTLMGTPALRALKRSFPDSQVHLLLKSQSAGLLYRNPYVDRILRYRNNPFSRGLLFLKTYRTDYDHILVFHANEDLWKILRVVRYGDCYNRQNYADPARRVIRLDSIPKHSIQTRLALVEKVGGEDSKDYRYDYLLPPSEIHWAEEKLREWGISPKDRMVGIQPGAADPFKRWPLESFVRVAKYLCRHHGVKIYLNASARERDLVEHFARDFGEGPFFCNAKGSLSQSAALIKNCSLFISNDTGPMHMAIGLGVPLIALFCPTGPEVTGPLGYSRSMAIQKAMPCNPCRVRDCPDNFCMRQISVEEVCQAAEKFLAGG
jgi:lipopolysaccharide heptosyltransferase II